MRTRCCSRCPSKPRDYELARETASLQNQIRKLEFDLLNSQSRVSERFFKDMDEIRRSFRQDFIDANQALSDDIALLKKQRARDKTDFVSRLVLTNACRSWPSRRSGRS